MESVANISLRLESAIQVFVHTFFICPEYQPEKFFIRINFAILFPNTHVNKLARGSILEK